MTDSKKKVVYDPGARGELRHHTGQVEYPTVNINGHIVAGFFPEKWNHLLDNPADR